MKPVREERIDSGLLSATVGREAGAARPHVLPGPVRGLPHGVLGTAHGRVTGAR